MRDKLIELIAERNVCPSDEPRACEKCQYSRDLPCWAGQIADRLMDNGVTMQTTPISYERLLELALKMHCWIFLHCVDEEKVYDQLGITEEENYVFGYGGKIEMRISEAPKEVG